MRAFSAIAVLNGASSKFDGSLADDLRFRVWAIASSVLVPYPAHKRASWMILTNGVLTEIVSRFGGLIPAL